MEGQQPRTLDGAAKAELATGLPQQRCDRRNEIEAHQRRLELLLALPLRINENF
jgi:hypothetical protein